MKTLLHLLVIICITLTTPLSAKETPPKKKSPTDIRRTTFIVNDAEKSLALYRDALGLSVIYDQVLDTPMDNGEIKSRRLIFLQANNDFIGVIGILQYFHPLKPQRKEVFNEPVPGDPIIVINVDNLDKTWPIIVNSPGVEVIDKPETIVYPRQNGGKIHVIQTTIRDPDGYWLEINQLLGKPATSADMQ